MILHVRNDSANPEVIVCRGPMERGNLINDATEETCIVAWSPRVEGALSQLNVIRFHGKSKLSRVARSWDPNLSDCMTHRTESAAILLGGQPKLREL